MNPTASKLQLLATCPASGALPAVWTEATAAMVAGTARHRYLQRATEIGAAEALAEVPVDAPWRAQCESLEASLDEVPAGEHEIAYAYDTATDTARCLGPWLDRAYDVSATEISGTADLVCPPSDTRPRWLVVDWKGEEEVEPAGENLQLAFFAACLARLHQVDEVDVAIGYLRHGGRIWWDRATLGPFDLEAQATRLQGIVRDLDAVRAVVAAGQTPDVEMGLHCRRCPALLACPAQTAAARAMLDAPPTNDALAQASAEDAGAAWVQVKVLAELADRVRRVLTARAEVAGLPLPDGTRLVREYSEEDLVTSARAWRGYVETKQDPWQVRGAYRKRASAFEAEGVLAERRAAALEQIAALGEADPATLLDCTTQREREASRKRAA